MRAETSRRFLSQHALHEGGVIVATINRCRNGDFSADCKCDLNGDLGQAPCCHGITDETLPLCRRVRADRCILMQYGENVRYLIPLELRGKLLS